MTTYADIIKKCAVCNKESKYLILQSYSNFSDKVGLDTRHPNETMCFVYESCPYCGYISNDISKTTSESFDYISSSNYQSIGTGFPYNSADYLKHAELLIRQNKYKETFHEILKAAWECDDYTDFIVNERNRSQKLYPELELIENMDESIGEPDYASICRNKALDILRNHNIDIGIVNKICLQADLLRRISDFEAAKDVLKTKVKPTRDRHKAIIAFQLFLINERDNNSHTVNEAMEYYKNLTTG